MVQDRAAKRELVPVSNSGFSVEHNVDHSWIVKDSHGHVQCRAKVDGRHLRVDLVGMEGLRLSQLQMDALMEVGSRWERYRDVE